MGEYQGSCFCGAVSFTVSGAPAAMGFAEHPPLKLVEVFDAELPTLEFVPAVHVNYAESRLRIKDGLPKFKDFPSEFGGSGTLLSE